jgi:hypothetical protein
MAVNNLYLVSLRFMWYLHDKEYKSSKSAFFLSYESLIKTKKLFIDCTPRSIV